MIDIRGADKACQIAIEINGDVHRLFTYPCASSAASCSLAEGEIARILPAV